MHSNAPTIGYLASLFSITPATWSRQPWDARFVACRRSDDTLDLKVERVSDTAEEVAIPGCEVLDLLRAEIIPVDADGQLGEPMPATVRTTASA